MTNLRQAARAPLAPALPRKGLLRLSPINRRRLDNFRRNKRGYWSFWIFSVLFVLSLFAEFIANDRPIVAIYKGEILFPIFVNYPEEKFGGFLAETDYRDPVIAQEIDAHGWMIWPPIHFSYRTHNLDLPAGTPDHRLGAPTPPTWALTDAQCRTVRDAATRHIANCRDIEWDWLGTDDQGRDVVARLIYGFRISILFGLILATISSAIGITAGAVQGFFGGWLDLTFSASSRSGRRCRSSIC